MEEKISKVVNVILMNNDVYQVTLYENAKQIVRATLRRCKGKIPKKKNKEITITIGKPNFRERTRIKELKKMFRDPICWDHVDIKRLRK